jgi:tRNA threonylcarbamoyl adenosine modification protein YeaZ
MIFAIESNSLKLTLCLLNDGKLISNFSLSFKNDLSEILIPSINNFLKKNTITLKDISFLAIGCGPGSFTSIRTLIAAAKGIIISNKHIKSIGINSLAALAMSFIEEAEIKNIKYIVSSIDSKRQEPFLQTFEIGDFENNSKLNPTNEIKTVKVQDLKKYLLENNLHTKDILFVGHNQKLLVNERMNLHLLESKNQFSDALGVAKLSYSLISSKANITQSKISYNKFKPLYVRFADIN